MEEKAGWPSLKLLKGEVSLTRNQPLSSDNCPIISAVSMPGCNTGTQFYAQDSASLRCFSGVDSRRRTPSRLDDEKMLSK